MIIPQSNTQHYDNSVEKPKHSEPEHQTYITTFKSVQNEDGETIIQTENKRVSQEEGVIVEEVLSDTEPIPEDTTQAHLEITEVSEPTGDFPLIQKLNNTNKLFHKSRIK